MRTGPSPASPRPTARLASRVHSGWNCTWYATVCGSSILGADETCRSSRRRRSGRTPPNSVPPPRSSVPSPSSSAPTASSNAPTPPSTGRTPRSGAWRNSKRVCAPRCARGRRRNNASAVRHAPRTGGERVQSLVAACEASLKRLQTDYIDRYQIHRPRPDTAIDETLRALDDLIHQGKVRYIGTSTFAAWQFVESLWASERHALNRFVCERSRTTCWTVGSSGN